VAGGLSVDHPDYNLAAYPDDPSLFTPIQNEDDTIDITGAFLSERASLLNGRLLLLAERPGMPTIADLSQPMLRLAGLRISPATNGQFQTSRGFTALTLRLVDSGVARPVRVPDGANLDDVQWAPDGRRIAFTNTTESGIALWIAETATGEARALTGPVLNGTLGDPCHWLPDGSAFLCRVVPADRGAPPAESRIPTGPIVQRNEGGVVPAPTFEDLLASPHDEALFEYYTTSQLALVDAASGAITPVGTPAIFLGADPAPGGRFVLVQRVTRPYSYQLTIREFRQEIEVWTLKGERVITLASVPLADHVPLDGVRTGPRAFEWRPGTEASVLYVEALDGGDNRRPATDTSRVASGISNSV